MVVAEGVNFTVKRLSTPPPVSRQADSHDRMTVVLVKTWSLSENRDIILVTNG